MASSTRIRRASGFVVLALLSSGCGLLRSAPDVTRPPQQAFDIVPGEVAPGDAIGADQPAVADPGIHPAYTPDAFERSGEHPLVDFGVVVRAPESWLPVEGEPGRIEGSSGYVMVTSADNESGDLAELCATEANHKLRPYGSRPSVAQVTVDGQPGCQIVPSKDQMSEGNYWGGLVVRYPEPWVGKFGTYRFVVLTADLPHLGEIIAGLTFA